jgi:L-glyceraldehyde 3-phosphate reductase
MNYTANPSRYEDIAYNRCGRSGIQLPPVSLGLWQNFGGTSDYKVARDIIHRAFDKGITHFDLANNYGPPYGSAEITFGRILREGFDRYRDELIISTKAGYDMWPGPYGDLGSRKYLLASLDQSLKRMGLEYVDIFYSHRPDPATPVEETMGALSSAVKAGKALYVGVSNYNAEQTIKATEILEANGTPCLIHQPRYNMIDRWVEDQLLDVLEEKGIGCIPFSPLAQGLLTDRYLQGIPEDSRAVKSNSLNRSVITEGFISKINKLNSLAAERGQSLAQMALAWLLKDERITSVLIGASSLKQLEDNLASTKNTAFTEDELKTIDQLVDTIHG